MAEPALQTHADASAKAHVARLRELVDDGMAGVTFPEEPAELYDLARYVLDGGGKRLRPILLLLSAEAAGGAAEDALPAALATEVFHNFTLVHDDIMDDASERRGRPAAHVVADQNAALLTGDLLMGLSYDLLVRAVHPRPAELVHTFHRMTAAVCEGQALDAAFERRECVSVDEYLGMIGRKTGALLVCVMELGAAIAGADDRTAALLRRAAADLGLAFQIQDDLLDLTADDAHWGKRIGGDLIQGKKTFLLLKSIEVATGDDMRFFGAIVREGGLPPAGVPEARERMQALGVLDEAAGTVERHCEAAVEAIQALPPTEARATLEWLARRLATRGH